MSESEFNDAGSPSGADDGPVPATPAPGPGAQLAAQREARGWSVEQVANQLNMAPRQIQALESDNYGALPGMVIARGFLRAYAKLLKMDPVPLLALVTEQNPAPVEALELKRTLSATYTEEGLPATKKAASPKWLPIVFLLILLAAGWAAYQAGWLHLTPAPETRSDRQDGAPSVPPASAVVTLPPPVTGSGQAASTDEKPSSTASTPEPTLSASAVKPQGEKPAAAAMPTPSAKPEPQAVPASPAAPVNAAPAAAGKNSLVLTARQDSWVEIRDIRKKVLVSHIIKAGATESFDVAQPIVLTVGNAGGVDVSLRGQPLDMKPAKNNVIRLDLK